MTPFEICEPRSLNEAVALLDPDDLSVRPIAGGTALMLMMKAGVFHPTRLISLRSIEEQYSRIELAADGELRIGAMTPLAAVERSPEVRRAAPVITDTLRTLSNIRVRNVATAGGNLAHADPHMDLPPVMIALGGSVCVVGRKSERTIAVEDLFAGYYETVLAKDELISRVVVPPQDNRRSVYFKVTTRAAHDWPTLGVAVSLEMDNTTIRDARVVISAATEKPTRAAAAESMLRGRPTDATPFRSGAEAAAAEIEVRSDVRGSAAYKKRLIRVYVERAIRHALDSSQGRLH
jgi:aerobic carbon-monoxide dehydrogenase medium subunit